MQKPLSPKSPRGPQTPGERIGILGGTFSPPHLGHLHLAKSAREHLGLSRVLFLPAALPPHKELPEETPDAALRVEMTRLAAAEVPDASVCTMELDRPGKSYTADTMALLRQKMPEAQFWLLLGTDMLLSFDRWKDPEKVLSHCRLAALCRAEGEGEMLRSAAESLRERFGAGVDLIDAAPLPLSSTELREEMKLGKGEEGIPCGVFSFIREKRLYGFDERLYSLRRAAKENMGEKRYAHTLGCEEAAARLAARWGADTHEAREAAILHDITKDLPLKQQLYLCDVYGIMWENMAPPEPVLHAFTGAEAAAAVYRVSDGVKNAIRWHTTGRENMSLLEKIIYIADLIEPGRQFPDVDILRKLACADLDKALLFAFERTIRHVAESGYNLMPETAKAREFLLAGGQKEKI